MSGHWEAEQYKEQLEASRTAHVACESARREALTEIDRLRAELEDMKAAVDDATTEFLKELDRAEKAEARLAAVIALCDIAIPCEHGFRDEVRAAATGDTQ